MSAFRATVQGQYYDGRQPIGSPVTIILAKNEIAVIGAQVSEKCGLNSLRVSPRVGQADRFIALPNGGQLQCPDNAVLNFLPQEVRSEGAVAWLEQRWGVAVACVAIIISTVLAGYFYALPVAAERIAQQVPIATERGLGEQSLAWLDHNKWFQPTKLDARTQTVILKGFAGLYRGLPMERYYRLEFRESSVGPNAFALPGGTIVITDDMVRLAQSKEEVLAVLAHEIGHVELRHTLRNILQSSVVAVVAATLTGDAATLSAAVTGFPVLVAQARYSRQFESEADDYAFQLLKQRGYSPLAFATIMERLMTQKHEGRRRNLTFLATHPMTVERIERARAAAGVPIQGDGTEK